MQKICTSFSLTAFVQGENIQNRVSCTATVIVELLLIKKPVSDHFNALVAVSEPC